MSGGGKVPDAPDLSKQTGQADQTFQTATSNAAQTMNTAQAYNKNSQNTINNVVGQETPMIGAVNNSANGNLNTYASTFTPLQQQQAKQAADWTSDANVQNLEGRATADVNSSTQAALANQRQQLASEGVDPASVHGSALTQQAAVQGAANAANAANTAYTNAQTTGAQLMENANQIGLQAGNLGTSEAATGANIGNSTAQTQSGVNAQGVNNLTAGNTYLNTGLGANKQSFDIAQGGFNDQQTQFQDRMANSSSMMSGIGSIAGAAAMFMERGGPVPHSSVIGNPDRASPIVGLPPRFMNPYSAPGLIRSFYEHGGPVTNHGALPQSPMPGSTDTKPAMLTPDEFVIPREAATWKGHEHWYKQIDKANEERAMRLGLPPKASSALTARGV
jgi:hypothetical protein